MASQASSIVVEIPEMPIDTMIVPIIGDTPLIVHHWSEKAKRQMREVQAGKVQNKKAPKDPEACYQGAFYRLPKAKKSDPDRFGFPSMAFKKAMVSAGRLIEGVPMTILRQVIGVWAPDGTPGQVEGLVPIEYEEVRRGEDPVKLNGRTADLRYRPYFCGWRTILKVTFFPNIITPTHIGYLLNIAGFSVGVGENRPEKSGGDYGRFHVETKEVKAS